jgi:hypothetical protein
LANALEDSFNFVLDKAERWFDAFRDSEGVAEQLFADNSTVRARVRAATTLWFGAFFLSMVIASPVYYRYGVKPEMHLTATLAQYCGLFAIALCFHFGLRIYGVRSALPDTFVLHTTVAAGLAPLFTLATLPGKMRMLRILSDQKTSNLWVALPQVFAHSVRHDNVFEIADIVAAPVVIGMIAIGSARLVPILTKHYAADEWRVIRALGFASAVIVPIPLLGTVILEVALCDWFRR